MLALLPLFTEANYTQHLIWHHCAEMERLLMKSLIQILYQ